MFVRIILLCILTLTACMGPAWLFVVGAVGYAFAWNGLELLLLTVIIDGYFGGMSELPLYTLGIAGCLLLARLLRPYLSIYNQQ